MAKAAVIGVFSPTLDIDIGPRRLEPSKMVGLLSPLATYYLSVPSLSIASGLKRSFEDLVLFRISYLEFYFFINSSSTVGLSIVFSSPSLEVLDLRSDSARIWSSS